MALNVRRINTERYNGSTLKKYVNKEEKYDFSGLVARMESLKFSGFLYNGERIWCSKSDYLWQTNPSEPLRLQVTPQWQDEPVAEICMYFKHFLTGETLYLHISSKEYNYKPGSKIVIGIEQFLSRRAEILIHRRCKNRYQESGTCKI